MPKNTPQTEEARQQEIQIRKQKNAAAQAAFRARRANYIATLEETVTSLESVVVQLQDSCRDAKTETLELRQQTAGLRHEFRERERFWRTMWQSRKPSANDGEELPPNATPQASIGQLGPLYPPEAMYRSPDDPTICQYPSQGYQSPAISYTNDEGSHSLVQRKYGSPYPYAVAHRDGSAWPASESGPHSESPMLTASSELSLPFSAARFGGEEQKVSINTLEAPPPYVFPTNGHGSRPISPTSTAAAFTFADASGSGVQQDRSAEFDFHRRSSSAGEVSLSGPGSDTLRYRLGDRRPVSRPMLPLLPPSSDAGSPHERLGSDAGSSRLRTRRDSVTGSRPSSPSTGPPLTGTLAVIKAQAFGALRRSRPRNKKAGEASAAKVAQSIDMGAPSPSKRQRTEEHD
uniref:BZIP domain-containing protein n=1 Tax=Mycena chlorophos TaxID=658473 RepID=A0ABQ0KZ63_MYCCL|nr:predicted protein [Mycena chlorophos]